VTLLWTMVYVMVYVFFRCCYCIIFVCFFSTMIGELKIITVSPLRNRFFRDWKSDARLRTKAVRSAFSSDSWASGIDCIMVFRSVICCYVFDLILP